MKKECFVFLSDENKYGSMYPVLLADTLKKENVYFVDRTFHMRGKIFDIFKKFFFSTVVNMKTNEFPSKMARRILKNQYQLKRILTQTSKTYEKVNVVFFNASIKRYYAKEILQDLKGIHSNINFYMFFMDPSTIFASESAMKIIDEDETLFEKIFTVDKEDATKNGWRYWPTPYSKIEKERKADYNLYFCGATKGRHQLLIELVQFLEKNHINNRMDVFYIKKNEKNLNKLLKVMDVKSIAHMKLYQETIQAMNRASCILEIVTEGQSATFTLRCYEAVIYNKKLLTNNKKIFEFPYYDCRYMKYFCSMEDIDIEWLKKDIQVDYKYQGEYSPIRLLEEIKNAK